MARIDIPDWVKEILSVFLENGHSAYAVGGCVRDRLMGREPNDWDIAVSCSPEITMSLFPGRCVPTGIKHGTVTIRSAAGGIEATTFRVDGAYSDNRHPDSVSFSDKIEDDLSRRDFTVNAMAADAGGLVIDPFGGIEDIGRKLLCAVGEPGRRFREDSLRLYRAFRFSAQLGFEIEYDTYEALRVYAPAAPLPSAERIRDELNKLLVTDCAHQISCLFSTGLMREFCSRQPKTDFSPLGRIPPELDLRLAALCALLEAENIASPETFLRALHYDGHRVKKCSQAVFCAQERKLYDRSGWRHLIADVGQETSLSAAAASAVLGNTAAFDKLEEALAAGGCLAASQLAVGGNELEALGMRGPQIGGALHTLLHHVVDFPDDNRPDRLLELAAEIKASK